MFDRTKLTAIVAALALTGAGAVALPAAQGADGPQAAVAGKHKKKGKKKKGKTYKTKVADDYFSPSSLKIKKGDKVKWKWDSSNGNSHNVTLQKGPKKVKKKDFTSATGAIGIKFNRTFKKPGTYKFICTIHPTVMQQTVKVKK